MLQQLVWSNELDIERIVDKYGNMLFRMCLVILCNENDAEDVVQDTFITYLTKSPPFNDSEHEKAWLITIATNRCKNMRRYNIIRKHMDINDLQLYCKDDENYGLIEHLMRLPNKHKIVLLLYYVEGYKVDEITKILGITTSAVKKRLQRGRELIREKYRKENE
ncbi:MULTISPECIES: RNA polymerase sigma factor [Lysinibacillus]|uniref:RNA polymerase sigma factor n=1 Tax=Lysinibacillus TaxID=400634 RepID=UPI0001DA4D36|nr:MULTISPECIES: RNA polymerase sigma factor [Lysinibacillus]EFI66166.1 RNA polymerase, sigma-24 subunit, ECF subfamily protein [Lysinibacillus fusiformis ZC1]EKU40705.1 RNA polymerase, sigma-24 subunit, ECF subfamily protein [Lysinibacillus fusiformis ZB2]WHP40550.1 RNA polymerase sigma factor [Lysinibacillus boronitolerans]MBX8945818.1 RNA polymerase sigma factor [Lysinibacillus sp. K60]UNT55595.1 RNA polymerase sigma factor [Lysinibacillus capsici]